MLSVNFLVAALAVPKAPLTLSFDVDADAAIFSASSYAAMPIACSDVMFLKSIFTPASTTRHLAYTPAIVSELLSIPASSGLSFFKFSNPFSPSFSLSAPRDFSFSN